MTTPAPPTECAVCNTVHDPTRCQGHSRRGAGQRQCQAYPKTDLPPGEELRCASHPLHPPAEQATRPPRPPSAQQLAIDAALTGIVQPPVTRAKFGKLAIEPLGNPLEELADAAAEMKAWKDKLASLVADLTSIRYGTDGGEAIRGEVQLYERSLVEFAKTLAMIAKLNIDERLVRIHEQQRDMILAAISLALAEAGVTGDRADQARRTAARHLRVIDGTLSSTAA